MQTDMTAKQNPLATQVGGNHYSKLSIQPIEFSMANRWDACAHSILKYVTRHRSKNGAADIEKAVHFLDLREELVERQPHKLSTDGCCIDAYVEANRDFLTCADRNALVALAYYVTGQANAQMLYQALTGLLTEYPLGRPKKVDGFQAAIAERHRQVSEEGFTAEKDDGYVVGELVAAAASYATAARISLSGPVTGGPFAPWPFHNSWWKPSTDPRRNIDKAMALLAAERERLDRHGIEMSNIEHLDGEGRLL